MNNFFYEFYGILVGDGCLSDFNCCGKHHTVIRIDGHGTDDRAYYKDYLIPEIFNCFGKKVVLKKRKDCNGLFLYFESKEIFNLMKEEFCFPVGKKGKITLNQDVLSNPKKLKLALRGIMDTDGSLYFTKNNSKVRNYPIIELSSHSEPLIRQLYTALLTLGFNPKIRTDKQSVKLNGRKQLEKWVSKIGFSNPKNKAKYVSWRSNQKSI